AAPDPPPQPWLRKVRHRTCPVSCRSPQTSRHKVKRPCVPKLNEMSPGRLTPTYTPHPEGWRDWPIEAPATTSDLGPRGGAKSSRSCEKGLEDVGKRPIGPLPHKRRRFFC